MAAPLCRATATTSWPATTNGPPQSSPRPATKPQLDKADPKKLVETLKDDNLWWRQTAQRLLVERGKTDVLVHLADLVRDPKSGSGAAHALWTMHGLGAF